MLATPARPKFRISREIPYMLLTRSWNGAEVVVDDTPRMRNLATEGHFWMNPSFVNLVTRATLRGDGTYSRKLSIPLHKFVMFDIGPAPKGRVVDHINGNPRDNRRHNLRYVSSRENTYNRAPSKHSLSGHAGVSLSTKLQRVTASYTKLSGQTCKKHFSIGRLGYEAARDAAIAWREERMKENPLYEFSRPTIPEIQWVFPLATTPSRL